MEKKKMYKLRIYLKNKVFPICKINTDNFDILKELYETINKSDDLVIFKERIMFNKKDFEKALIF